MPIQRAPHTQNVLRSNVGIDNCPLSSGDFCEPEAPESSLCHTHFQGDVLQNCVLLYV